LRQLFFQISPLFFTKVDFVKRTVKLIYVYHLALDKRLLLHSLQIRGDEIRRRSALSVSDSKTPFELINSQLIYLTLS
jgi:hypothetical protein